MVVPGERSARHLDLGRAAVTAPETKVVLVGLDSSPRSRDAMVAGELVADAFGDQVRPVLVHRRADTAEDPPMDVSVATKEVVKDSQAAGLRQLVVAGVLRVLVVGSLHRGALRRAMRRSVEQALLPDATCPIIVVPAGYADEIRQLRSIDAGSIPRQHHDRHRKQPVTSACERMPPCT